MNIKGIYGSDGEDCFVFHTQKRSFGEMLFLFHFPRNVNFGVKISCHASKHVVTAPELSGPLTRTIGHVLHIILYGIFHIIVTLQLYYNQACL